jgi:hypothetical protein
MAGQEVCTYNPSILVGGSRRISVQDLPIQKLKTLSEKRKTKRLGAWLNRGRNFHLHNHQNKETKKSDKKV